MKYKKTITAMSFIVIGLVVGVILTTSFNWTENGVASQSQAVAMQNTSDTFADVSENILPKVVSIAASRIIETPEGSGQFFGPLLRDYFGKDFEFDMPEKRRQQGLGSGVIVKEDGYIITNNHVIANADELTVTLYDDRQFDAKMIGGDPLTDIGVIKIDGDDLPVANLGNSDDLRIGEWVLAVGNPLYLTSTVTAGIVSAKGRSIGIIRRGTDQSGGSYAIENFIQTDAAINPGNSGGALVALNGDLVGINTAIASQTGGYQGYGFAVPINLANKIMSDLIEKGYVTRAWMGVSMRAVTEKVAKRFDLERPKGVLVENVMEDSPAERAGLEPLDIILEINGEPMSQTNQVQNTIALKNPGDKVRLTILRDGDRRNITVELGQKKMNQNQQTQRQQTNYTKLGLNVTNLTNDILNRIPHDYYRRNEGVIVTGVKRYSQGFEAGIREGDLITKIENTNIQSVSDYQDALDQYKNKDVIILTVKRQDRTFHAFVELE